MMDGMAPMCHNFSMIKVPEHILYQIHVLAAEGMPIEQIEFMMQLSRRVVEEELRNPTITRPVRTVAEQEKARSDEGGVPEGSPSRL